MRSMKKTSGITVRAISGTYVILLAFDVTPARRKGLLGFAIQREDHTENEQYWLRGFKTFESTEPDPPPGSLVSTLEHPIQGFLWGDYTTKPTHDYTYTVVPMYGTPKNLREGPRVGVDISTSKEDIGKHAIYFNRGVAGSQAYARRFGNVAPRDITDESKRADAYRWLSRGLEEAALHFLARARGPDYSLRAAVYEFNHLPVLEAFGEASRSGSDVKIIYDRRTRGPWEATERAVGKAGIGTLMIRREEGSSYISHNKFIVLLHKGKPVEVWTGSTNFTSGGLFGQSNVGHLIRDERLARAYFDYWTRLSADPKTPALRTANVAATPDPTGAMRKGSLTPIFSPRTSLAALEWYSDRMDAAQSSLGFTAAFGISGTLAGVFQKHKDYLRYIIVESEGSRRRFGNPPRPSAFDEFQKIRDTPNNRVAVGSILQRADDDDDAVGGELHRWLGESLTGLNTHVRYLHTKYMFTDALTGNPTVVSGSANFSKASTQNNDENMVVIQGDTDVADIYLGEFLRLFNHFYFREIASRQARRRRSRDGDVRSPYLQPDDGWTAPYFEPGNVKHLERKWFAGVR